MNDIEVLEEFEKLNNDLFYWIDDDMGGHFNSVIGDQKANTMLGYLSFRKILENLLKERQSDKERIKHLEERIESLLCDVYNHFIRKSLIKEKIEELKKQIEKTKPDDVMMIDYYETKIQVLEELLKGE